MASSTANQRPLIIGLTGGIGSGKTVVSNLFAGLGVDVIDADIVSRAVVAPGEPALKQLSALVKVPILREDGSLDRGKLRELLFRDDVLKHAVEQLLHPLIRQRIRELIAASRQRLLILVAPLLLENNAYDFVDRVLVVDAPEALQISRTSARDSAAPQDIERIMRDQLSREARLQRATDVIVNDGDLAQLEQRVVELHGFYQALAAEPTGMRSKNPPSSKGTSE